jgi:hypothetical protein
MQEPCNGLKDCPRFQGVGVLDTRDRFKNGINTPRR